MDVAYCNPKWNIKFQFICPKVYLSKLFYTFHKFYNNIFPNEYIHVLLTGFLIARKCASMMLCMMMLRSLFLSILNFMQ